MSFWQNIKSAVTDSAQKDGSRRAVTVEEKALIEQYVADGWNTAQIAEELDRPIKTVHPYVHGLRTRTVPLPVDPHKESKSALETIRLDTEKIKLEMLRSEQLHKQEVQKIELEMQKMRLDAELHGDEDDEEDESQSGPEALLMQILSKAFSGGVPPPAQAQPSQVPPGYVDVPHPGVSSTPSMPSVGAPVTPEQLMDLAGYIKAQGWSEKKVIAEAKKRGVSAEEAKAFYQKYIAAGA